MDSIGLGYHLASVLKGISVKRSDADDLCERLQTCLVGSREALGSMSTTENVQPQRMTGNVKQWV